MNTNDKNEIVNAEQTIAAYCTQSYKKLLAGIEQAKNKIANEFQEILESHAHLFQLALNEAEALAFQTDYPHLLFPTLAAEKIQMVAVWRNRQQNLHQPQRVFAEAA